MSRTNCDHHALDLAFIFVGIVPSRKNTQTTIVHCKLVYLFETRKDLIDTELTDSASTYICLSLEKAAH